MEKGWVGAEASVADREAGVELERSLDWADLQLPDRECERLHAIARSVRQRAKNHRDGESVAGVIALFVGERGTGKTMAARILGAELGRPVLEVDVQGVRMRDEAEIDAVFAAADREDAILLIEMNRPPADAREGSSDDAGPAVDICLELVQRATRHPGLVIFTWIPGHDPRLGISVRASALLNAATDATVRFPIPSAGIRERIWRAELPPGAPLSEADLRQLANSFRLPGGAIKWCCAVAHEFSHEGGVPVTAVLLQQVIEQEYPEAAMDDGLSGGSEIQDATAELAAEREPSASARSARQLVIGAALAAAVLGFLLARGTSGGPTVPAPAKPAANVLLRVSIPGGWYQRNAPTGVTPSLSNALAVAPAGQNRGLLVLGRSQTANPGVLRPFTGLATVSAPQLLSLGGTRFYRYANVVPHGANSSESVYALPTTAGTVLGVCEPQAAGDKFAAQCERVLASLKLLSGSPVAPGPSASLGAALDRVIKRLSLARGPAEKRFDTAGTPAAQASAAAALAAAYGQAGSALGSLDAGTARPAAAALATALAATANAYSGLVSAAHRADVKAYRVASAELSAARNAVNSALSQLNALGYRVS